MPQPAPWLFYETSDYRGPRYNVEAAWREGDDVPEHTRTESMASPTNIDAFFEGRARAIRQANREMYCRQLLSALDPQRADQDLDYADILRRVQAVVTQELATVEIVPTQAEEGAKTIHE